MEIEIYDAGERRDALGYFSTGIGGHKKVERNAMGQMHH